MNEVLPGIFHLPLPMLEPSPGCVNAYLVRGGGECLLVDTGWGTGAGFNSLKEQLACIGVGFADISQIVITHTHPDHYGLSGRLKQLSPARVAIHHLEGALIELRYTDMERLLTPLGRWLHINGVPAGELPELQRASVEMLSYVTPALPDVILHGGETITVGGFNLQVLWTPGHSAGHVSLYEPQRRVLFCGDHILLRITPNIGRHPGSSPNPLDDYLNSLTAMKQLEVDLVLPGHEHPFAGFRERIEQIIRHHGERNAEILATAGGEAKTAYRIASEITWMGDRSGASWDGLEPWHRRMAVLETLSHLEAMSADGRLDKQTTGDIVYYRRR